ncbi:MAG: ScpA family protein [Actinomycetota bacterium]|jgi:segregation and condensation protein A|nr:ScpA family protein [Actinomycetota bacterium]
MVVTVCTPVYEGPLDALLHLVTTHQLELYDIPLGDVVEAFLGEMASSGAVDLSALSEFLVVLAVLVELKSRRLLPGPDEVETDEELEGWEVRDVLLARLLECQAYGAAGDVFAVLAERAAASVPRSAGIDPTIVVDPPDLLEGVDAAQVAQAYRRATAPRPAPVIDLAHVTVDTLTVAEAVSELVATLPGAGRVSFRSLTGHLATRLEVIVRFLAVLELCKQGHVTLDQGCTFGDLEISWTDHAGAGGTGADETPDEYEG